MKEGQRLWTRDELILAINLYCKLPFGRLHRLNPEVINLSNLINRTPSSVALKLVNFASLDQNLKERGIKGASNASKLDNEIWNEFFNHLDILPYESEKLLAQFEHKTVEQLNNIPEEELPKVGKIRERVVMVRVNQSFFRSTILAAYNNTCCITGINQSELLIAGHTDNVGNVLDNQKLSDRRAYSVVQYLISKDIASDRLEYAGFGESKPLHSNDTEEGRQANRRIEFTIRKDGKKN